MVFTEARVRNTNYLLFEYLTAIVVYATCYVTFYVLRKCRHHRTTYLYLLFRLRKGIDLCTGEQCKKKYKICNYVHALPAQEEV